jgi:hypothetical protein
LADENPSMEESFEKIYATGLFAWWMVISPTTNFYLKPHSVHHSHTTRHMRAIFFSLQLEKPSDVILSRKAGAFNWAWNSWKRFGIEKPMCGAYTPTHRKLVMNENPKWY